MAFTSYPDLISAVSAWAARTDITVPQIQEFISMAEAKANQLLRVPSMEAAVEISSVNGRLKIPQDFMELRAITTPDGQGAKELRYVSMDQWMKIRHSGGDISESVAFTRQGPYWYIASDPADGTNYTCYYYAGIEALSSLNPVNWLLQMSPQAYLYGALSYLFEFTFNEARSEYWMNKFMNELSNIKDIADAAEYRGSIIAVGPIS